MRHFVDSATPLVRVIAEDVFPGGLRMLIEATQADLYRQRESERKNHFNGRKMPGVYIQFENDFVISRWDF